MYSNKMKYMFIAVAVVSFLSLSVSRYTDYNTANVSIYEPKYSSSDEITLSSGTVEYSNQNKVITPQNLIVNKIYVEEGQRVNAGDKICECKGIVYPDSTYSQSISNDITSQQIYTALANGDYSVFEGTSEDNSNYMAVNDQSQQSNEEFIIYSDYDGIVTKLNADEGEIYTQNSVIASIAEDNSLKIRLNINEAQISDVKVGQNVIVTGAGFKDRTYNAVVTNVAPYAEKANTAIGKSATVMVTVAIQDADEYIKSGYTAKCCIITSTDDKSILIPYDYICCDDAGGEYVYVYKNGFAKKEYIKTGNEYPDGVKVISGVTLSDKIISNPTSIHGNGRAKIATEVTK